MAGGGTVIVVGAGPTGLALSAELALAGVQVRVLDRRSGLRAAVLARPDGYIAWASDERDASLRTGQARAAVRTWCGSAENTGPLEHSRPG